MAAATEPQVLDLQHLISAAIVSGKQTLILPRGRYRVTGGVKLSNATDFAIEGYGCELLFPPEGTMFEFVGCKRLTLKGFTVDCDPLPFTQGTVVSVADDHSWFEYEVHDGYPRLVPGRRYGSGVFVFAPDTRYWRAEVPDIYPRKSEILSPTRGRITYGGPLPGNALVNVGDLVAFKDIYGNGLVFRGCDDVTVRDVTAWTTPCAGFLLRCCTGPIRFSGCTITRGPRPAGATQDRLLSTVADAFNVGYSREGPVVENCEFAWMGDDSVNLHGAIVDVVAVEDARTLWLGTAGYPEYQVQARRGDTAQVLSGANFGLKGAAKVVSCKLMDPPAELASAIRKTMKLADDKRLYAVRLTVDGDVPAAVGDSVEIPETACPGFVFRNNRFHDHRARGLRLGASHGLIEGNRFERIKSCAISLGPHAVQHEGCWVRDIMVRSNVIRDVCFDDRSVERGAHNSGAIVVQHFLPGTAAPYPQENTDIVIEGNDIDRVGGAGILATSALRLRITGNRIVRTQQVDCTEAGSANRLSAVGMISLNYCRDVTIDGNSFGSAGPSCKGRVVRQDGTTPP